jgi:hypothetical protein
VLKALVFLLPLLTVLPVAVMTFVDPRGEAYATARLFGFVLLSLLAALMTAYVAGEDSYRHDGTSVWSAYQVGGRALAAISVTVLAAYLVLRARRGRGSAFTAFGAALLSSLLSWVLVVGTGN